MGFVTALLARRGEVVPDWPAFGRSKHGRRWPRKDWVTEGRRSNAIENPFDIRLFFA
jgi:hypothetical protein